MNALVAKEQRNSGDRPNMTVDAADAVPMMLGKFFVAVNSDEKKLRVG